MTTVAELRSLGNKVRVCHRRWYVTDELKPKKFLFTRHEIDEYCVYHPEGPDFFLTENGGETVVELTTTNGVTVVGIAECSKHDNYVRKLGVRKALGRALSQLEKK